jgi:hypothetical protein
MDAFLIVIAVVGGVASIIGIPAAYYFARGSRQRPNVHYVVDFAVLLDPSGFASGGELTFRGRAVDRVSRTYVAVWNDRGDTVRGEDIVDTDPFRIQLGEGDAVLQTRLLYTSREQCRLVPIQDEGRVALSFDFLDEGDGGVIEVIHEGSARPTVTGTIRGASLQPGARTADLRPDSLQWMRRPRWRDRTKHRLRRARDPKSRRTLRRLAILIAAQILVFGIAFTVEYFQHRHPRVVDPADYNLKTLDGQSKFAHAVRDHGRPESEWAFILPALLFLILPPLTFVIAILGWRSIPRSIAAHYVAGRD